MAPLEQEEQPQQDKQPSSRQATQSPKQAKQRANQQQSQAREGAQGEHATETEQDAVFGALEQLLGQLQQALSQPSADQAQAGAGNAGGQASKAAQQGKQAEGKNGAQAQAANSQQNVAAIMAKINEVAALAEGKGWTLRPQQRAVLNAVKQSNDTTKIEVLNLAMRLGTALQLVGEEAEAKQQAQGKTNGAGKAGKDAPQGSKEAAQGQGQAAQPEPTQAMQQLMQVTQITQSLLFKQPTEAELGKVYEAVETLARGDYGSPEVNGKVGELLSGARAKIGESIAQNPEMAQASSMIALVGVGMQREQAFAGQLVTAMSKYKELGAKMQAAKTPEERSKLMAAAKELEAEVKQFASANMDIIGGSAREGDTLAVNRNPDNPMAWIGQTLGEIGSSTGVIDELQKQQEQANRAAEQERGKAGGEHASRQAEHDPHSAARFAGKTTKPKSEFARHDVAMGRGLGKSTAARKAGMNPSVNHPGVRGKGH